MCVSREMCNGFLFVFWGFFFFGLMLDISSELTQLEYHSHPKYLESQAWANSVNSDQMLQNVVLSSSF